MRDIPQYHRTTIGPYRLLRFVGPGPISRLYEAERQDGFTQKVAVKIIEAAPFQSDREQQQVLQELSVLSAFTHRFLLPVLETGIDEHTLYLVYPYVEAGSLRQRLTNTPAELLPIKEVLAILRQVGEVLYAAHQQQLVHGNLKPENVLFSLESEAVLSDFRLQALTQSERIARTCMIFAGQYMAPEQFQGVMTPLSDQYALACLAYLLLTGVPPFEAADIDLLALKHANEQPRSPALLHRERTEHMESVILKALAKKPEERYPDVAAFLSALLAPPPLDALIETRILPSALPSSQPDKSLTPAVAQAPVSVVEQNPVSVPAIQSLAPVQVSASQDAQISPAKPLLLPARTGLLHRFNSQDASAPTIVEGTVLSLELTVTGASTLSASASPSQQPPAPLPPSAPNQSEPSGRRLWVLVTCIALAMCISLASLATFFGAFSHQPATSGNQTVSTQTGSSAGGPAPTNSSNTATPGATVSTISVNGQATPGKASTPGQPSPAASPTATSSVPVVDRCSVTYTVASQWSGGFVVNMTVTNTGSATFKNWSLTFSFAGDQHITNAWDSSFSQSGAQVTIINAAFNNVLAPGSSATPGFQGTWTSSDAPPTAFALSGVACGSGSA
jgi:serine/threonine protein kinase